jgi:hypothetical protein
VAAASPVSEVFSLLSTPPTFMTQADEDLIRFFVAMRSGQNSQTGSATEPRGKIGAALLNMLAEQDKLLWANSWADVGNGLVYPLKGGVLREANLAWREEGKGCGWAGRCSRRRAPSTSAPTRSTTCCRPIRRGTSTTCRAACCS